MSINVSLSVDPSAVLGVGPEATLQEIRDAYRLKAKKYHPDAGGEDWAFRILVQSYETLSAARVGRAAEREASAPPRTGWSGRRQASPPPPPRPGPPPRAEGRRGPESVRPGVRETASDPGLVVDVEKLAIRFPTEHVWLLAEHGGGNRVLSCSLNVSWPDPKLETPPSSISGHDGILQGLQAGFESLATETQADSSRWTVEDGRFSGWLAYSSNERANQANEKLARMLHMIGLSVQMSTRDLIVPRQSGRARG